MSFLLSPLRAMMFISAIACLYVCACSSREESVGCETPDTFPRLAQQENILADSNGLIVDQKLLQSPKAFQHIKCYKIAYVSGGLRVVGFVVKPEKVEDKLPVLIYNRGGNREFGKIVPRTMKYLAFLASRGYVVLASQYRGNDGGEGRDQFGGDDVNDILNLVPLARSLPFADEERIVMLGYSRGGMMTYLAIKHGAPLKAAAVVGGVSDLLLCGENRPRMKNMIENELIGKDREEYINRSAVHWPQKLTVPLLILHGADDWRSNVAQATVLAARLDSLGYEHRLEVFEGGDHGLSGHKRERNQLIFEWFASHLDQDRD